MLSAGVGLSDTICGANLVGAGRVVYRAAREQREAGKPSVLVVHAARARLGPARHLGHDDLVDAQHRDRRLGGQLERPPLCGVQVKHALRAQVLGRACRGGVGWGWDGGAAWQTRRQGRP